MRSARSTESPTVSGCPGPSGCATSCRSPTTSPAIPSAPSGSSRWRPRWSATTGSAASCVEAPEASQDALRAVHPERHIRYIDELSAGGGGRVDMDTIAVEATYAAALRAAGGGVALVDALLTGEAATGFSALRPPGHHAEPDRAMGFCFFGNAAVAARHAQRAHGAERVLIVDWDVHHGNGTNEIFRGDPSVLFVSIHESPLYPGTGPASDLGSGAGEGYTVNLPVPARSGDETFRSLIDHVVLPLIGGVGAAARAGLRGLRRAPPGPARELPGQRARLRGDDRRRCGARAPRSARRWGWCSRAATRSRRSRTRCRR